MSNYSKPIVLANEELAEGVYAASGGDCYTVNAYIHQTPETGRGDYRIQANATHAATDGHHSGQQTLVISFNQPVEYNGQVGSTITATYNYHNNGGDYIGLGDFIVTSDAGLSITNAVLYCNYDCGQHTWSGNQFKSHTG